MSYNLSTTVSYNKRRSELLGMSVTIAARNLRKEIVLFLARKCGMSVCYKCNKEIETSDELSIEHKIPWMYSGKERELYFDLNNIAFSHKTCNKTTRQKRRPTGSTGYRGVYYNKTKKRAKHFRVQIHSNGVVKRKGYFLTAPEAAEVYDKMALEMFGPNAITNKSLGRL